MTKEEQLPRLGRMALLALVEWITKHRRSNGGGKTHGVGTSSQTMSLPISQPIGRDGTEETESEVNAGREN